MAQHYRKKAFPGSFGQAENAESAAIERLGLSGC
jgi:hypothetical protein